jgi:hypothetical protein
MHTERGERPDNKHVSRQYFSGGTWKRRYHGQTWQMSRVQNSYTWKGERWPSEMRDFGTLKEQSSKLDRHSNLPFKRMLILHHRDSVVHTHPWRVGKQVS